MSNYNLPPGGDYEAQPQGLDMNNDPTALPSELLNHPILTSEQEKLLFALMAEAPSADADTERWLLERARNDALFRLPSDEAERSQWEQVWQSCENIPGLIVACNQRFVAAAARAHVEYHLPMVERFRAGQFGLLEAIRRFDATRGTRFTTYAKSHIRSAIQAEDARQNGLKITVVKSLGVGYKFAAGFSEITGSAPDEGQLYRLLLAFGDGNEGRPRVLADDAHWIAKRITNGSNDVKVLDEQHQAAVGPVAYPGGSADTGKLPSEMTAILEGLPERQRLLVNAHFGLSGVSLEQAAEQLGMTNRAAGHELRRGLRAIRRNLTPSALSEDDIERTVQAAMEQLGLSAESSSARVLRLTLQGYTLPEIYYTFRDSEDRISRQRILQILRRFVLEQVLDEPQPQPSNETQIFEAIARGEGPAQIALRFGLSARRVKNAMSKARKSGLPVPPSQTVHATRMRIQANLSPEEQAFGNWLAASIASRKQQTP